MTLALAACGGGSGTPNTGGNDTPGTGVITPDPGTSAKNELTGTFTSLPDAKQSGETVTLSITVNAVGGYQGNATVSLADPPAGVSATPVTVNLSAPQVVSLQVHTTPQTAGLLSLNVHLHGTDSTKDSEVMTFAPIYRAVTLPNYINPPYSPHPYFAQQIVVDGENIWISGQDGSTGGATKLTTINKSTGTYQQYTPCKDFVRDISGLTVRSNQAWIGNSGESASLNAFDSSTSSCKSVAIGPKGQLGEVADLITLSDNRIAFIYENRTSSVSSLGIYDPSTDSLSLTRAENRLNRLALAPDGSLWTSWIDRGANAVLVKFDVITKTYAGTIVSSREQNPTAVQSLTVASNGHVWASLGGYGLAILDPSTGKYARYPTDFDHSYVSRISASGNAAFLNSNFPSKPTIDLLTEGVDSINSLAFPFILGDDKDVRGFTVSKSDTLVYESNGVIYILP